MNATINDNISALFQIADDAKKARRYDIANKCFAALSVAAISKESGLRFVYEMGRDNLIEALASPHGYGYYDLPAVTDGYNYLCIPLPLVSRSFMNSFVMTGADYVERGSHCREYIDFYSEAEESDYHSDLEARFLAVFGGEDGKAMLKTLIDTVLVGDTETRSGDACADEEELTP